MRALSRMLGTSDWQLRLWDGQVHGPDDGVFALTLRSRRALDRLMGAAPQRGFGRAYVEGEIEIEPLEPFLATVGPRTSLQLGVPLPEVIAAAIALGARPVRMPSIGEARLRGRRHSRERDGAAIRHHYDQPVEFYRLWLDRSLTYSCAYFETPDMSLEEAQEAKLDLVLRKLRLRAGETLLDVGCGWGSLVVHAAERYGARAIGITLSPRQVEQARRTIAERGLEASAEVRLADYRDDLGLRVDAIASVGMVEHVGGEGMEEYVRALRRTLRPGGRLLLHGITRSPDSGRMRGTFVDAFVFPDGDLQEVGEVVSRVQRGGFEVRDLENLREHYDLTLQEWSRRLEARVDAATEIVGCERVRIWRLNQVGSYLAFRAGRIAVHQLLAVRPDAGGQSGLPLRRADWYG